ARRWRGSLLYLDADALARVLVAVAALAGLLPGGLRLRLVLGGALAVAEEVAEAHAGVGVLALAAPPGVLERVLFLADLERRPRGVVAIERGVLTGRAVGLVRAARVLGLPVFALREDPAELVADVAVAALAGLPDQLHAAVHVLADAVAFKE